MRTNAQIPTSFFRISAFLLITAGFSLGCGGGGGSDNGGTDSAGDVKPDAGQDIPVDAMPETGTEIINDVGKDIGNDQAQPPKCDPACVYTDHQYCDESDGTCKDMECRTCYKDANCDSGETCLKHVFQDGTHLSICTNGCLSDADCKAGFNCDQATGQCLPMALCKPQTCGEGAMGDPCDYHGVNAGCTACVDGLDCKGRDPIKDSVCMWDADCLTFGIPWQQNPQCVDGLCAYSFCTTPCDENDECPEGFGAAKTVFACTCVPVGTSKAGEACPIFNVNMAADSCDADLTCLGIEAKPDGDACTSAQECTDLGYLENPECVDGFCGISFCAPMCDANGDCDSGFGPIDVSGACFCAPVEVGDSQAGDPCPIFNVNPDADACAGGLTCLGVAADDQSADCATAADCSASDYFGNPVCVDGFCGTSFCSPKCDADDECEGAFGPIDVNGKCYCAPKEVGESSAGEPCPIFGVNSEADACLVELTCLGIAADENALMCTQDSDCSAGTYPGSHKCIEGRCGTSFCSAKCDAEGKCGDGFEPIDVGEKCYCAPAVTGNAAAGDPCPLGNVNTAAEVCAQGLECLGLAAFDWSRTCNDAGECPQFAGMTNACFMGFCGMSSCAAKCDDTGACPDGGTPYLAGGSACFCITGLDDGNSAAGEACPYINVNLDAQACVAGTVCRGLIAAPEDGVQCETAADCDPAANPGVADCVDGNCGSSFCSPPCDGEGACDNGFEPFMDENDHCFCAPLPPE
ncbi:MAG: hypothetical protein GXP54_04285 [Deltaproteobacteria bacterium]|nr:hypothetical protein [Deltaproteobacteria bacterium]